MWNERRLRLIIPLLVWLCTHPLRAQNSATPASKAAVSYRISGTVINVVDNQPLAGVEVVVASTQQRDETVSAVTTADGRFVFTDLARGKYSLSAHRQGLVAQSYQQHGQYSTAIVVGPDFISENLVFPITPEGSISGTVLDEENEIVRGGEAILFNRTTRSSANAVHLQARGPLDEFGHYHFGHLSPGSYLVAVVAQPWYAQDPQVSPTNVRSISTDGDSNIQPQASEPAPDAPDQPESLTPSPLDVAYPTTYYPSATEAENAAPIQLRPGERVTADVNLRAVAALHLRIRNASSDPTRPLNAMLEQRLFDTPIQVQARNQQVNSGVLTLAGIPPGHFTLSIRNFTGREWISLNKEVDVSTDADVDATENSASPVIVKGVVHLQGNSTLPAGAFIRFSNNQSGETLGAQVDDKGEFEAQTLVNGQSDYSVAVLNVPKFVVQTVTGIGARVTGHTVSLPRSGTVQLDITISNGLARVNGTVVRDDKPVSEAMVLLVPEQFQNDVSLFRRDQSDSDGTFSLYQVLPGRYTVVAIENGWELDEQNPAVLKPYLDHGQMIEITANKTYDVSVKLQTQVPPASSAIQ
jgi:hypothetical protein